MQGMATFPEKISLIALVDPEAMAFLLKKCAFFLNFEILLHDFILGFSNVLF